MHPFFSQHKRTFFALIAAFFYSVAITYATPPLSQYNPAETLDPSCAPGDTNCSVSLYPDQTGNAGAFLTTNGTSVSWATIPASTNIYNTDGTLTGNRVLTLSGNALDIAGTTTTRFFDNGNVGIGTTTASSHKLDINGSFRAATGTITDGYITSSWSFGALEGLSINTPTGYFDLSKDNGGFSSTGVTLTYLPTASFQYANFYLPNPSQTGATLATLGDITTALIPAFIQNGNSFGTTATLGTNDAQPLMFETNNTERLVISSTGNVGVGTSIPGTYRLNVIGPMNDLNIGNSGAGGSIDFGGSSANSIRYVSSEFGIYTTQSNGIRFYTGGSNLRTVITSGGNVLIGTATDAGYKLDVNGTGRFTGDLNADGSLSAGQNARIRFAQNDGWGFLGQAFGWYYQGGVTFPFKISNASLLVGWNTLGGDYGTGNLYVNGNTILGSNVDSGSYKLDVIGDVRIRPGSATLVIEDIAGTYTRLSNGGGISFVEFGTNDAYFHQGDINFSNGAGNVKIAGGVKIGSTFAPHASAIFDVSSSTRGALLPRMTDAERTTIGSAATGLLVYQTDTTEGLYVKNAASWQRFLTTADIGTTITSDNIYNANGTLTGARTLTLGGNNLDIAGTTTTRFFANGNVGIGTTTDSGNKFTVTGSALVSNNIGAYTPTLTLSNTSGYALLRLDGVGSNYWDIGSAYQTTDSDLVFSMALSEKARFTSAGNFLLNTTTDAGYKLDVNGAMRVQGTIVFPFGSIRSTNEYLHVGPGSSTASYNYTFASGNALSSGAGNVLVAGGNSVSTGSGNTVVGFEALQGVSTQGGNTAVGRRAGRWYQAVFGSALVTTNSIYIGDQSLGFENNVTNETVIGSNAIGAGSDSVTIGNNAVTATFLKGAVGIGRTWTTVKPVVHSSAVFDIESTTKGALLPRMTNAQRTAITTPATGLLAYSTDATEGLYVNTAGGWQRFLTTGDTLSNIYTTDGILTGNRIVSSGGFSLALQPNTVIGGTTHITQTTNGLPLTYVLQSQGNFIVINPASPNKFNQLTSDPENFWQARVDGAYGLSTIMGNYTTGGAYNAGLGENVRINTSLESIGGLYTRGRIGTQSFIGLDGTTNRYIRFWEPGVAQRAVIGHTDSGNGGHLVFKTGDATTLADGVQAMRIFQATQNIIVGTSTVDAGYRLDVNGTLRSGAYTNIATGNAITLASTARIHWDNREVAVGEGATSVYEGIAIGYYANAGGSKSVIIGKNLSAGGNGNVVMIGGSETGLTAAHSGLVSINSSSVNGISIGGFSNHLSGIAIGSSAQTLNAAFEGNLAIGLGAGADGVYAVALGSYSQAGANEFVAGSRDKPITNVYFGGGNQSTNRGFGSGTSYTINGSGAYGTDFAGGTITLAGGKGTGTGTPGNIIFSTATALGSGSTLQSLSERARFVGANGNFLIGTTTDSGYKLDVSGTGRFGQPLTVASSTSTHLNIRDNADILRYTVGRDTGTGALTFIGSQTSFSSYLFSTTGGSFSIANNGDISAPNLILTGGSSSISFASGSATLSRNGGNGSINLALQNFANASFNINGSHASSDVAVITGATSAAQLRLQYDGSNNTAFSVGSTGNTTIALTGTAPSLSITNLTVAGSSQDALCIVNGGTEVQRNNGAQTCTVSSARFKHDIQPLSGDILGTLTKFTPSTFIYNDQTNTRIGLIAEEVATIDPRLVFYEADGTTPRGVRYEDLAVLTLKGLQEITIQVTTLSDLTKENTLRATLTAWLGDVGNGIGKVFANTLQAKEQVCIDDVCINKEQLRALIQNQVQPAVPNPSPAPEPLLGGDTAPEEAVEEAAGELQGDPSIAATETGLDTPEEVQAPLE